MLRRSAIFVAAISLAGCSGGTSGADGGSSGGGATSTGSGSSGSHGSSSGGSAGGSSSASGSTGAASSASTGIVGGSSSGGSSGGGTTSGGGSSGGTTSTCPSGPPGSCTVGATPDVCAPYGYVCALKSDGSDGCVLPTELTTCLPCVGCADASLQCTAVDGLDLCIRSCATTNDCPDAFSTCQTLNGNGYCLFNACSGGAASAYGSCSAAGTNDGLCLPNVAGATCLQNGGQAAQAACSTVRAAGGDASQLCSSGYFCIPNSPGSNDGRVRATVRSRGLGPLRSQLQRQRSVLLGHRFEPVRLGRVPHQLQHPLREQVPPPARCAFRWAPRATPACPEDSRRRGEPGGPAGHRPPVARWAHRQKRPGSARRWPSCRGGGWSP